MIAKTPNTPYYAVIFTSLMHENHDGYAAMADKMEELSKKQHGYLGIESARSGIGITVSYWESLEAIRMWKENWEHCIAQQFGKEIWYKAYQVRVCVVERDYGFVGE